MPLGAGDFFADFAGFVGAKVTGSVTVCYLELLFCHNRRFRLRRVAYSRLPNRPSGDYERGDDHRRDQQNEFQGDKAGCEE